MMEQKKISQTFAAVTLAFIVFCSIEALASAPGRQQLKCYIVPKEDRLHPIGRMDPGSVLHLAIAIPGRHRAELDQFVQNISDPKSPEYKHFLSPQEFALKFGPAQADYDAVSAFFKHRGFTVTTFSNRSLLDIDGTVKKIEATFHTTLRLYKHPTENRNFYAPDENPSVDLGIPLSNIAGLDNFLLIHPVLSKIPTHPVSP